MSAICQVGYDRAEKRPSTVTGVSVEGRSGDPASYKPTPSPLVPGILVGDTLYLSGSTGGDPVSGQLVPGGNGERDGNGVKDVQLFFSTYAYTGN